MRGQEATAVVSARPVDPVKDRRQRLRERLSAEWIAGAEEEWRKRNGRGMTSAELELVLN